MDVFLLSLSQFIIYCKFQFGLRLDKFLKEMIFCKFKAQGAHMNPYRNFDRSYNVKLCTLMM